MKSVGSMENHLSLLPSAPTIASENKEGESETLRKYNADMAANPLWKVMSAVAAAVEDDADLEEDDGEDSYVRHMRFECRQGNFI